MTRCRLWITCIGLLGVGCAASSATGDDGPVVEIYIVAGQSNAVGLNHVREFHGDAARLVERLEIASDTMFWPGSDGGPDRTSTWTTLRIPGAGGRDDAPPAPGAFGPEVGFAIAMRELEPERRIAIVKYARNGTGIARSVDHADIIPELGKFDDRGVTWNPGTDGGKPGTLYRELIDNVRAASRDLDARKIRHVVAGLLWVQGEHEAGISPTMAAAYGRLLGDFVAAVRRDVARDDLPVFVAEINTHSWRFADAARCGQADFCAADGHAHLVRTADLSRAGSGGPSHFDADGMLALGERLAAAVIAANR